MPVTEMLKTGFKLANFAEMNLNGVIKTAIQSGNAKRMPVLFLDYGAWSVIKHMYPEADVPIIEMSLDHYQTPRYHYDLMKELASLRKKGVLII